MELAAESNANSLAILIYRALAAKGRNGFACLLAESNQDGVINDPVAARQFIPQGEFCLIGRFCFNVVQPVGNPVHMGINTNRIFAVSKRDNKIGCFTSDAFDAQ